MHTWAKVVDKQPIWKSPPQVWERLKPLAREHRTAPTTAEARLWAAVRSGKLDGAKFRRHYAIERYIVDFYCRTARLVIEVDGPTHLETNEEDLNRQLHLEAQDLTVLRFTNAQVLNNLEAVIDAIRTAMHSPSPFTERGPEDKVCPH
jgi:very-short-patch-repair endonuclease